MTKGSPELSREEIASLIARGDQIGYRTVKEGRRERVEPVNLQVQIIFERALARFRQQ